MMTKEGNSTEAASLSGVCAGYACGGSPRNRLPVCPECGGKLGWDKSAVVSENGFIYRARLCAGCGGLVRTKQGPEEFCGFEPGYLLS